MLGSKAGLLAVGKFVGKSGAGTRTGYLGKLAGHECSGNGRRGEKEVEREEEDDRRVEGWEEREMERWREWRIAEGMEVE